MAALTHTHEMILVIRGAEKRALLEAALRATTLFRSRCCSSDCRADDHLLERTVTLAPPSKP
jgi:hypothetical protein